MKKAIYTLGILALASLSVASCHKTLTPEDEPQEGKLVTVTFIADSQGTKSGILNEGTSTVSYKWTENDTQTIRLYTVSGGTLSRVDDITTQISSDGVQMTITATVAEGSTVRAILASSYNLSEGEIYLQSGQSPTASSFYQNGDVLISDDEVVTPGRTEFSLIFHRKVVISKMTLTGLPSGEKIQQVIITSKNSGKMMAGTMPLAGGDWTGTGAALNITLDPGIAFPEGSVPVYFTSIPNDDVPLNIKVYTNLNVYEKDLSGTVSFKLGQFTKFSVALPQGTPLVADAYTWEMAEGDLSGTSYGGLRMFNEKGTPAMNWLSLWMSVSNGTYPYVWDSGKGIKIGTDDIPCSKYLLASNGDPVNIQSVRVCFSGSGNLSVKAGAFETSMTCNGRDIVPGTADPIYYTFTCDDFLRGPVRIFVDDATGPFYIKSVEFNPTYSRGTAGQDDTVNGYGTSF